LIYFALAQAMATLDIKIQNRCDHRIAGEHVLLGSDGLTLLPSAPLANVGTLIVTRNDVILTQDQYSVSMRTTATGDLSFKQITLRVKDPASDPYYELSYNTIKEYCPKCVGTDFTDDYTDNKEGDLSQVTLSGQLIQMVEKIIITRSSSNKYARWVGTKLHDRVGSKVSDFSLLATEIKSDIRTALTALKDYQTEHMQVNGYVDPSEVFGKILSINVQQDIEDPTVLNVTVFYSSRSGQVYDYTQYLELSNLRARG
jgi:hypothetical protein